MPGVSDVAEVPETAPRVAVIAALSLERAPLQSRLRREPPSGLTLHQSGAGFERAYRAAQTALREGAAALVSWGVAGGLVPGLTPGTILLPQRVLSPHGALLAADVEWRTNLLAALQPSFRVHEGDLLGVEQILATPRSKAHAANASGAVAVDMESAAVAEAASEAGRPFVVLRVVADGLADTLPPGVEGWVDDAGNQRLAPALETVLRPTLWRGLFTLAQRYREARRVLAGSAHIVVSRRLLFPHAPPPRH